MKIDLTGNVYSRLTVMHATDSRQSGSIVWKCRCSCGNFSFVRTDKLTHGVTISCGCYRRPRPITHGLSKHPLYGIWQKMIIRCYDETSQDFGLYGARGITVCRQWRNNPIKFHAWALTSDRHGRSLDRVNNNKGYSPSNCRWSTPKEQADNRRSTVWTTVRGQKMSLSDAARLHGLKIQTVAMRRLKKWPRNMWFIPVMNLRRKYHVDQRAISHGPSSDEGPGAQPDF